MNKYESNVLTCSNCIQLAATSVLFPHSLSVFIFLLWSVFACQSYASVNLLPSLLTIWRCSCDLVMLCVCYSCFPACWLSICATMLVHDIKLSSICFSQYSESPWFSVVELHAEFHNSHLAFKVTLTFSLDNSSGACCWGTTLEV